MWVLLILILFAGAQASSVQVRTCAELRDALEDGAVEQVIVAAKVLHIEQWPVLRISRAVGIRGSPGATLDFQQVDQPLLLVDAAGVLRFSSLILANYRPGVPSTSESLQHIISTGGRVYFTDVVFFSDRHGASAFQAGAEFSTTEHSRLRQSSGNQPITGSRAWRLDEAATRSLSLTGCSAVLDAQSCCTAGSALAFDSASLHAALSHPAVSNITVVQDVTLQPEHCNSGNPVFVNRPLSLTSCPGAVLNLSRLDSCWIVSSGGLLQLGQGLHLSHTASSRSSKETTSSTASYIIAARKFSKAVFNPYAALLLSAVTVADGGAVVVRDTGVQISSQALQQLQELQEHAAAEAAAAPLYRCTGPDGIKVLQWHIVAPQARQKQQQELKDYQLLGAALSAPQQQQLVAASRRLLQRTRSLQDQQPQHPEAVAALRVSMGTSRQLMATLSAEQNSTDATNPDVHAAVSAADSHWKQPNQAVLAEKYPRERCFSDFRFLAKDITQFVRLIKDPATSNIELTGNIVFSEELFPPANANNQSLGINITQQLTIRACTGDPNNPIIVDVNNLQQQIYVYGEMRWEGNIRFINSFPSPRRAGLFPLISVLSVEGDGIIWFEDIHIHGNEPCPLFDLNDPFWDRYSQSPLSVGFVPQRHDFELISNREILLFNWTFNKTAWVLNSQGTHGVVKAVGDGYWQWVDVLVTWAPDAQGPQGAMVAAIVVPVVVVCVVASALGFFFWRRRRTKEATVAKQDSDYYPSQDSHIKAADMGGLSATTGTALGLRQTSTCNSIGSKTDNSKSSYNTHELIEEARRRMQDTGRKEANIVLEGLLGEGTFGKVYRGVWQGTTVAVKTMLFPAAMSGKEKREKMAIMETAISSSLSHPNVVQTYTYVVKPLTGELAMQALERSKGPMLLHGSNEDSDPSSLMGSELGENHGWEVRLVLELCDRGSLKELLSAGGLHKPDGKPNMAAIVATALDVARAMLHLHSENIIHSDLKARNVLLKSAGGDVRGFLAKVSDFGLSVRMDPTETHVSNVYQGTLTHMAPEVLMYGKISRASDVYAFGILMWELYTAQQAFKGTPRVLLGHEVTKMGIRPEFPPDCPFDYQLLACRCWESDPAIRPSFQQILADLQRMTSKLSMVDSASSLPMPAQQQATCANASQMQTAGSAAMGTTHAAAARPQHAAAVGGIDPAKLHNWEPQTSLLDLRSVDSAQGSSQRVESAAGVTTQTNDLALHPPSDLSWGTQSAGGLWLGGEFAPSNMPSDVQLPVHGGSDHIEQAAAGLHPQEVAVAVAAAARQQHALQQAATVTGGIATAGHVQWRQGLAPPVAAGAANPQQLLQHQQPHAHHLFVTDIRRPEDLQDEKQLQQQHQQQQHLLCMQNLGESDSVEPNSVSSSGVYLEDQSSTMCASSFTDSAVAGSACAGPLNAPALGSISQQHNNMATIVEESEGQAARADG